MRIGVIGLGHMGAAIASRLVAEGHDVTVYNRSQDKAKNLLAQGATMAHDPAGTADGDMVITMLSDDHAVESVVLGQSGDSGEGLVAHQGQRTIHVSMSTISAQLSKRIDDASKAAGKAFISAPVMGRPDVAEAGQLIVMASGDRNAIGKCEKAFAAFAKNVHILGTEPQQANIAKLAANFMISSMIETFGEAFALLRKNNVDHHKFLQVMASEFFQSPIYEKYGEIIASEQFEGKAFTVELQEKDTRLALAAAIESQVPMPFLAALENTFLSAIGRGMGALDPCAIAQIAADNAGVSAKVKAAGKRESR